jgi:hypothetical protein
MRFSVALRVTNFRGIAARLQVVVHLKAQGTVTLIEARSVASSGAGRDQRPGTPRVIEGTVSEVVADRGYFLVRTATGVEQIGVPGGTRIALNGSVTTLERLMAGMAVAVEFGADRSVVVVNARG